jgi:hypothetical protein
MDGRSNGMSRKRQSRWRHEWVSFVEIETDGSSLSLSWLMSTSRRKFLSRYTGPGGEQVASSCLINFLYSWTVHIRSCTLEFRSSMLLNLLGTSSFSFLWFWFYYTRRIMIPMTCLRHIIIILILQLVTSCSPRYDMKLLSTQSTSQRRAIFWNFLHKSDW